MKIIKEETIFELISTFTDTTGKTHRIALQHLIADHVADEIFYEIDRLSKDESFLLKAKKQQGVNTQWHKKKKYWKILFNG